MDNSKVYYIQEINSENLIKIYNALGVTLKGKVAVKLSSGEPGGHNFLSPKMIEPLVTKLNGTIVECNTSYGGRRTTTKEHEKVMKEHGFTDIAPIDIMDSTGELELPVKFGKHLKVNYVGKNLENYDSMLMLSHFKGHAMGGFGGALKNMSIGIASRDGKAWIHSAGVTKSSEEVWIQGNYPEQNAFLEAMAEADEAVIDYMRPENIVYINVANNLSVDCDCDPNPETPCMKDIGIFASKDPVACDQACIDAVWGSDDPGKEHFKKRVERQNGRHILPYAESLGIGSTVYDLVIL